MACSVIYVEGSYMESYLYEYQDNEICHVGGCTRFTNLVLKRCHHIVCERCLSKTIGETDKKEPVFVCPLCFSKYRKSSTWISPEKLYNVCVSKKLCTQCFEEEAIHINKCGHVLCKNCLHKLDTKTGFLKCGVFLCGKAIDRSDVIEGLKSAKGVLMWRYIRFPKYRSCDGMNLPCQGNPILMLKNCEHSYCYCCAKQRLRKSFPEGLSTEDNLKCVRKYCKSIIPADVLDNYLLSLQERFALTAFTLEISSKICYKCKEIEDSRSHVHIRNKYCAVHHTFCIKCIQEIQRNRQSEISSEVLGTEIVETHMRCFVEGCSITTPMACMNIMLDILLGRDSNNMVDVFLRKPDIGIKCDTCRKFSALVTRIVCSHSLCFRCIETIALSENQYHQCSAAIEFCSNKIPTTVFKRLLESEPSTFQKDKKQTTSNTGHEKVTLNEEDHKNKGIVVLRDLPDISLEKNEYIDDSVVVVLRALIKCSGVFPSTRWQRNGVNLILDDRKHRDTKIYQSRTLTISNLQKSDEGEYTLIAESACGEKKSNAISVQLPGERPKIIVTNESVKGDMKKRCLRAVIDSQLPITKSRWQKDGRDIHFSDYSTKYFERRENSSRELVIHEPRQEDEGRYKFIAKNAVGEGESEEIDLEIMKDFSVLTVEMKLSDDKRKLQIVGHNSASNSIWNIVWLKDDKVLDTTNISKFYTSSPSSRKISLVIYNPSKHDEGHYKLRAMTAYGCVESQAFPFTISKEDSKVTIEKNDTKSVLSLHAIADSQWPIQEIEWFLNGHKIATDSGDFFFESSSRKGLYDILNIMHLSEKNSGRFKVSVKTAAGDIESEIPITYTHGKSRLSTRQEYDASKYTENNVISSAQDFANHIPDNSNIKKGTQSRIALIHPPFEEENKCVLCEKTAVIEMVHCNHRFCSECLQMLGEMSESMYIDCVQGNCPSYVTKKAFEEFCNAPFLLQIQMPMHFGIAKRGYCQGLCTKKAVFKVLPCNHMFCIDCLQKCREKSTCICSSCWIKVVPSLQYFDNLFSSLCNENENPFLLKRNDANCAGYMASAKWMCLTYSCGSQADFIIIRCGHTFCLKCGTQMETRSSNFAEFRTAKCLFDNCEEIFPFPIFLQSNKEQPISTKAGATTVSDTQSSCSTSSKDRKLSENKKNQSDNNQSEDKSLTLPEKRKEVSKIKSVDKRFKPAPSRGLKNIGLSCYRNGILQILAETPEFLEILHDIIPHEDGNWISSLYSVLQGIKNQSTMEKGAVDCLHAFHHYFNQSNTAFQEYQQDDTLSFLTSVLNGIEDAHSAISKSKEQKVTMANPSDLFKGQLRDKYVCKKGKHIEFFNESNFYSLPLPVDSEKKEVTIGSSLVQLLKKEEVDLPCSKCASNDVTKEMEIETFPKILVLQICKVEEVSSSTKKRKFEKGDTKFRFWGDFKGLTTAELKRKNVASKLQSYRLYGVVVHWGSERGGHYICFVKRKEDQIWNKCDDSYVVDSNLTEVMRSDPYLLFYERFESRV